MSVSENSEFNFAIIINTDSYAGNFERQFCAYTTGGIGECGVGGEESELFREWAEAAGYDRWVLSDNLMDVADDRGCRRPTSIWIDRNHLNYKDIIIFLDYPLNLEQWQIFEDRVKMYTDYNPHVKIEGYRMIKRTLIIEDEDIPPLTEDDIK